MMRCWKHSPLGKPQRFHRCTRFLNVVCKCKMCTSALSMDGQRWFRCRWWSVDSPLHPRRHRCRWLTWDRLHPLLWTSIWRHHRRLHPLQRQLLAVLHLHRRPWSSGPSLPVVGSLLPLLMPREAASSSLAITQMGWPHLPPPIGGPNGSRSSRHVGHLGGGGGEKRGKPRCGRALRSTAGALRIRASARRGTWLTGQARTPWRSARARLPTRRPARRLAERTLGAAPPRELGAARQRARRGSLRRLGDGSHGAPAPQWQPRARLPLACARRGGASSSRPSAAARARDGPRQARRAGEGARRGPADSRLEGGGE
jgi:hypothetical protein